jgi:hypothetical protein
MTQARRKGKTTPDELWKVVKAEQGQHRDDFGSAVLYEKLAETEFQPIWRDKGTQTNPADDPLEAWLQYIELQFELEDNVRPTVCARPDQSGIVFN